MVNKKKDNLLIPKIFLFFVFSLFFVPTITQAQCGNTLKEIVVQEIGNATYLKDFRIRLDEGSPKKPPEKEFPILLNKGTHYRFNIKANKDCTDQIILKLFDFTKAYGGNYDPDDGTSYEFFDFFCSKTQVYYISMSFANAMPGCAVAIVSMVGNYDTN